MENSTPPPPVSTPTQQPSIQPIKQSSDATMPQMNMRRSTLLFLGIVLILLLGVATLTGYYAGVRQTKNAADVVISEPTQIQRACTMEAMLCPDGSSVGRVGPDCEFAACPEVSVSQ